MEKQLKDRSYYENRYDHQTIRILKDLENMNKRILEKNDNKANRLIGPLALQIRMYKRYEKRYETIEKWIERDKKLDEFFENIEEPFSIVRCRLCNIKMDLELKNLDIGVLGKKDRILFIYRCSKCKKGRAIYDNGQELESKKDKCKKCDSNVTYNGKFEGDVFIKKYSCSFCGIKYTEKEDFSINNIEKELITQEDIDKYGYNKEDEEMSRKFRTSMHLTNMFFDELKNKDKLKEENEKLSKIKKYNLVQIENIINNSLENTDFTNFKIINKENIKNYFKCEFEVYYSGESSDNLNKKLDKILKGILSSSNWKLQEYKTTEKLGVLNGFLFGYDSRKDLLKLVK